MKDDHMKAVLESIAQRGVSDDVNLWPHVAEKVERKTFMQTVRTRPVFALVIVLLALALLSSVAYAIGKATGYVPGVGIVDQSVPIRVLAGPIVMEREDVTVTITQVVTNAEYTFVAYAFDGISIPRNEPGMCSAMPFLQLPDGATLSFLSGGEGGWGGEVGTTVRFETAVYFPPIPANVDHVTFALDCVLPEGTGPENWQIPLELIPAPEGFVTPAVEIGATFVASGPKFVTTPTPTLDMVLTPVQYDPSFPNTPTPVPNGSGLYLEQVIELPRSYILVGNFADAGDLPGYVQSTGSAYDYLPRIEDASGNPVVFKVRDDIKPIVNWANAYYWAYEIAKPVQGSLKITLDEIDISTSDTVRFNFDAGPDPQPGQEWLLGLPLHLGRYDYVVDAVQMIDDGYVVKFHSGTNVPAGTAFQLDIVGSSQERGSNTAEEDRRGPTIIKYSESITYLIPPPTGPFTFALTLFETVPLGGPWTLTWTPPSQ